MCPQLKKHPCICVTSYLNSAGHQAVSSGKDELFGTSTLRWCQEDFACWRAIGCCQDKLLFGHGGVQCRHYLNFLPRLLLSDYLRARKCVCVWISQCIIYDKACMCVCALCVNLYSLRGRDGGVSGDDLNALGRGAHHWAVWRRWLYLQHTHSTFNFIWE